jgi:hypothetical protein
VATRDKSTDLEKYGENTKNKQKVQSSQEKDFTRIKARFQIKFLCSHP